MTPPTRRGAGRDGGGSRQRRASRTKTGRLGNLERLADDDDLLARHEGRRQVRPGGDRLLHRFNRLARHLDAADGEPGTVCGFDGESVFVRDRHDLERSCRLRRVLTKMLRGEHSPLCIGDRIRFRTPETGEPLITAVLSRRNQLVRRAGRDPSLLDILAANLDLLVAVSSLGEPACKPGLIDRFLLIAHAADIEPIIVLNKCDLGDPRESLDLYRGLGYPVFTTVAAEGVLADPRTREALRGRMAGRTCVFLGQSGVGKSCLIRALYPESEARIGPISSATGKGRHTTTNARSYLLEDGTTLVDTPGIRACGLPPLEPRDVALLYRDIASRQGDCRFPNCTHTHEPGCAVKAALETGALAASRYRSYRSILTEDLGLATAAPPDPSADPPAPPP